LNIFSGLEFFNIQYMMWYVFVIWVSIKHVHFAIPIPRLVTIPIVLLVQLVLIPLVKLRLPIVIEHPPRPLNCKCCPLRSHLWILIYICILILILGSTWHFLHALKKIFPTPVVLCWRMCHIYDIGWYMHMGVSVTCVLRFFDPGWNFLTFNSISYICLWVENFLVFYPGWNFLTFNIWCYIDLGLGC
jgi:hypothetical protein